MGLHRRFVLQSLAAAALSPGTTAAQSPIGDDGARVEALGDDVFAILHDDATDEWPHSNVGVIVGRRSVFVVDSNYLPSRAAADIALIRRISDKPVSKLVTTHWHFDHNNGAIAYRDAFPRVELIAERETARWLELNQSYWRRIAAAPESSRRAALAELEAQLTRRTGEDGVPFSAAERERRADIVARRCRELQELATLRRDPPTRPMT